MPPGVAISGVEPGDCNNCRRRRLPCGKGHFSLVPACQLRSNLKLLSTSLIHCKQTRRRQHVTSVCVEDSIAAGLVSRSENAAWRSDTSTQVIAKPTILAATTSNTLLRTHDERIVSASLEPQATIAVTAQAPLPAPLNIAAFQDNVHLSWLLQHYIHRPVLRDAISLSARNG